METNKQKLEEISAAQKQHLKIPVEQARPDESDESIMTLPSAQEVQAAVEELNPDENSMESRG